MDPEVPSQHEPLERPPLASFLDACAPFRVELYRYCRHLTRSPWDAEDLTQDTLTRAFAALPSLAQQPASPKAWLFRVASNAWLDRVRRKPIANESEAEETSPEPRAVREAAGTLLSQLSPQERAAVVLSDVFDYEIAEIAETLETTSGAIKAALHRGRRKLIQPETDESPARMPAQYALEAFVAAFNARDLEKLTSLLLDDATTEIVGVHRARGREAARHGALSGMLFGAERMARADQFGGIDPRTTRGVDSTAPRAEIREVLGEPLLVFFYSHADGEAVRALTRLETSSEGISRVRNYFYTPELLADVCTALGLPYRTNGYRYWDASEPS